ncbi:MAG: HAMP domain-containing protein [Gammaproteobacteria bacterium]|nr:HAMP domain-containing protein [Gammaproteobacteria bacterium]
MSLAFRLNLVLTLLVLASALIGGGLVIRNAQRAVAAEAVSTADLTLQLLKVALAHGEASGAADRPETLVPVLRDIGAAGHLAIRVATAAGAETVAAPLADRAIAAPAWFVSMVTPPADSLTRLLELDGTPGMRVFIRASAADEIEESWDEARPLLVLIALFALTANAIIYLVIGRWLRPIYTITDAIEQVSKGHFDQRIEALKPPELQQIAAHVNRMAAALQHADAEKSRIARQGLSIQEDERRALARELHDEMGQSISAIKAVAVSIRQNIAEREPEAAGSARTIEQISSDVYASVRGMMSRLRPGVLDELGLVSALQEMVDAWNAHHDDTFCRFNAEIDGLVLDRDAEINVYRIVQEALTNVARHAAADTVSVALSVGGQGGAGRCLRLTISDDGTGFEPSTVRRGLGLLGIHERVALLGGTVSVESARGHGVTIDASIPT